MCNRINWTSSIICIILAIVLILDADLNYGRELSFSHSFSEQDTVSKGLSALGSNQVDSIQTQIDSVKSLKTSSVGMDTILNYNASIVDVRVPGKKIYLIGKAEVKYKTMHLAAEKISLDWETNLITAEGVPDTVYKPSENPGDSIMTVVWRGLPTLSDAGDVMHGAKMIYNYKTEKGRVVQGRTEFEGGYYTGESMKRIGKEIINISNGYFTSCDRNEDPHYHFRSRRIKVMINDKVIAKPIVFYFGKIPVAALPFAVFPNKKGRHSGILVPTYGESSSEGRFIRGLGYYWAASQYFDASLKMDYFDRSGVMFRGDTRYNIRYILNGSISGSLTRKNFISGNKERRWDLRINHRHEIDPTASFAISGWFVSDNRFYKDLSSNFDTRLNRKIRSDATFSKSWPEQRMSLSANLSQERDVETGRMSQVLPQLRFSMNQRAIFGKSTRSSGTRSFSSSRGTKDETTWYQSIYFSYNSNLYNSQTRGGGYQESVSRYINHNVSLSMNVPQKIFGWLSLGQSVSYEERWYDRYRKNEFNTNLNSVESDTVQGFAARRIFSYNLSSSTKIYGMFTPNIGKIQAIRHIISPSLSFSYQPDFSDPKWGYVDTFYDTSGNKKVAQRLLDGVPSSKNKSISFSVGNLFQMKTVDGEKEKKFDLFNLNFSSGYNFEAEKFKLSNLSSSFRSSPTQNLNINMSANHSFYKFDIETGQAINQLLVMDKNAWKTGSILRLNSFNIGASLSLQGSKKGEKADKKAETGQQVLIDEVTGEPVSEQEYYDRLYEPGGNRFEVNDRFSGLDIPWRMSLSFSFSLTKYDPRNPSKNYYLDIGGMEVQLTKNWKINYSAHYDIEMKRIVNQSVTIYRDLHCWEARLIWRPSGIGGNSYFLRINVKSPQLRDLKYEMRGGRNSVLGY
ncbi:MAG TPA: putative LPS assembly protein LptD [bacterium]